MKKLIMFVVCFCFVFVCGVQKSYSQDLSFTQKIEKVYDNFLNIEIVAKIIDTIQYGWNLFKEWFNNLPGIRDYNNSVYSSKNWKKAMNDMGNEYSPHLKSDSAGAKMLREGKKNWDNL